MGIIYKNSVQYSGMIAEKGGSDDRELTQAEYDALSEEEKMNGTTYYITDNSFEGQSGMAVYVTTPEVTSFTPSTAWVEVNKTSQVVKLEPNTNYSVVASAVFTEGTGEFRLKLTPEGGSTKTQAPYNASGHTMSVSAVTNITTGSTGNVTVQTSFRGEKAGTRWSPWNVQFIPTSISIKNPEHTYSTTEQEVGTWIDGKTIYKRSISVGTIPTAGQTTFDISSWNIVMPIKIEGFCYAPTTKSMRPLPNIGANPVDSVRVDINNGNLLRVTTPSGASGWNVYTYSYVTIYYTKN